MTYSFVQVIDPRRTTKWLSSSKLMTPSHFHLQNPLERFSSQQAVRIGWHWQMALMPISTAGFFCVINNYMMYSHSLTEGSQCDPQVCLSTHTSNKTRNIANVILLQKAPLNGRRKQIGAVHYMGIIWSIHLQRLQKLVLIYNLLSKK